MKEVFTGRPQRKTPQHPVPHQDLFFSISMRFKAGGIGKIHGWLSRSPRVGILDPPLTNFVSSLSAFYPSKYRTLMWLSYGLILYQGIYLVSCR